MRALIALALAAVTLWAYHALRSAGFVYEDTNILAAAKALQAHGTWWAGFRPRALMHVLWRAQYAVGGARPWAFHLFQLSVHLVNGALVGWVVYRWTQQEPVAWLAAALFLVHPLNSEAVAYIGSQSDVCSTTGVLLATGLIASPSLASVCAAVLALAVGVGCKEFALLGVIPMGFVLWPRLTDRARWMGGGATVLAVGAGMVWAWQQTQTDPGIAHGGMGWLLYQSALVVRLTGLFVWPQGFNLDVDAVLWSHALVSLCFVALISVSVAIFKLAPTLVKLGWAWWLICLAPRLVLRSPEYLHEHHAYMGSVGLCLIAAVLLDHVTERFVWER